MLVHVILTFDLDLDLDLNGLCYMNLGTGVRCRYMSLNIVHQILQFNDTVTEYY